MKKSRKALAILGAVALLAALAVPAFAFAGEEEGQQSAEMTAECQDTLQVVVNGEYTFNGHKQLVDYKVLYGEKDVTADADVTIYKKHYTSEEDEFIANCEDEAEKLFVKNAGDYVICAQYTHKVSGLFACEEEGEEELDADCAKPDKGRVDKRHDCKPEKTVTEKACTTFPVDPYELTERNIAPVWARQFTGEQICPRVTVFAKPAGDHPLIYGKDFLVDYGENVNVEEGGFIYIKGIGNYCGVVEKKFCILPEIVPSGNCKGLFFNVDVTAVPQAGELADMFAAGGDLLGSTSFKVYTDPELKNEFTGEFVAGETYYFALGMDCAPNWMFAWPSARYIKNFGVGEGIDYAEVEFLNKCFASADRQTIYGVYKMTLPMPVDPVDPVDPDDPVVPQTGDSAPMTTLAISLIAVAALAVALIARRKAMSRR